MTSSQISATEVGYADASRLRVLVERGIALGSELTLDSLLHRLIETAVELTGARYGALGVVDRLGTGLDQFITVGIDPETQATIGPPPHGRGILGVLISDHEPLRLRELSQDPRSVGYPPGHPPMSSFLGCPITLRGTAFGNLYLTEKRGAQEFSDEDEVIVRLLAAQAAVAIENARLYESARQWGRQLESLNVVSEALASELNLEQLFRLAANRLRALIDARIVMIQLPSADGLWLTVEPADGENATQLLGRRLAQDSSKSGRTLARKRAERIDALIDDPEVDQTVPRLVDATAAIYVPLTVRDRAVGVIAVYDKNGLDPRFSDADMRVAEAFANRAAIALDLSERVGRDSVRVLLDGQETERTRLARELHDETGQALVSIMLGLKAAEDQPCKQSFAHLRDLVTTALDGVRRLTTELRPPTLDDFGLQPALQRLTEQVADRSGLDIHLHFDPDAQALAPHTETAIYRIVQEALTNTVKHAKASSVSVLITTNNASIRTIIEDDGIGFATDQVRDGALGLVGMQERVTLLGGRLDIESAPGAGTTLSLDVPP